jgi:hypothetical protein
MSEDFVASSPDPRTAEVLRVLSRAKGMVDRTEVSAGPPSPDGLAGELLGLREWLLRTTPLTDDTAQSLASTARVLERAVGVAGEKLADLQRHQEAIIRELRERLTNSGVTRTSWPRGGLGGRG